MDKFDLLSQIKKAQTGDAEAFGIIYDRLADMLYRFLRTKAQQTQAAEDLLQETMLKIWKGLPGIEFKDEKHFTSWAFRVAMNSFIDSYRKSTVRPELHELKEELVVAVEPKAEKELDAEIDAVKLHGWLKKLPANYSTVLELRFIAGLSVEETAKTLNKTSISVRLIQHRAIKKLKNIAGDNYA